MPEKNRGIDMASSTQESEDLLDIQKGSTLFLVSGKTLRESKEFIKFVKEMQIEPRSDTSKEQAASSCSPFALFTRLSTATLTRQIGAIHKRDTDCQTD